MRLRHNSYSISGKTSSAQRNYAKYLVGLLILLGVVLLFWLGYRLMSHHSYSPTTKPNHIAADGLKINSIEGRYMFSGTIVLDRTVARDAMTSGGFDYTQPFGGMAGFGNLDSAIADLECPVTPNNFSPQAQINVDNPKFNCQPSWLPTLKKYFPIVNLSSNHQYDRGEDGFNETVSRLQAAGFQTVGNFNPHIEKEDCKVIILPVRLVKSDQQETKGVLPTAFCSFNYKIIFSPEPGELEAIRRYQAVMPVVGLLNAGSEYKPTAGPTQVSIAHAMIDYGAEFVISNGTHWVQNTEAYKGRLIAYSLGNFIFDQSDYESRRSANIVVNMHTSYDDNLAKWLDLGKQCQPKPDTCLALAQNQGLRKLNLKLSFSVIAAEGGFHTVTHKADATLQKAVEQRLDWAKTEQGLTTANQ